MTKSMTKPIRKFNIALAIALVLTIIFTPFTSFASECNQIRENVLRLHIIPNSDSQEDQNIKLIIRDEVIKLEAIVFEKATDLETAKKAANENLELIQQKANDTLKENGFPYSAKAEVCNMFFDTRYYDDFTLPAGHYDAFRITLGNAKGSNWWCVLYPPLCLPAATPKQDRTANLDGRYKLDIDEISKVEKDAEFKEALSDKQVEIVRGKSKYEVRFASVELFEKFKKWVSKED